MTRTQVSAAEVAATAQDVQKLSELMTWNETKRIQTQVSPVAEDTTTIRCLDWDRDRFDIEFGLQARRKLNLFVNIDFHHHKFYACNIEFRSVKSDLKARSRDAS